MKTILIYFLALFAFSKCEEEIYPRKRRGSFQSTYPIGSNQLQIGGVNVDTYGNTRNVPLQETGLYASGVDKFLPLPDYNQPNNVNFNVDLTGVRQNNAPQLAQIHQISQISYPVSNAVDKPVNEPQEYVPPQSVGTAIIPPVPPPAIPVNAAASNVPAGQGALFLGSGSLGVIDLGGGAYALGSGSLGYSVMRSNPRSSFRAPLLPPVQAAPNLLPAAVPSPQPQIPGVNYPLIGQPPIRDQNGYEYLAPNRVAFGSPLPPRPLKTTMAFATPSNLQIQPQLVSYQPVPQTSFGDRLPNLYQDASSFYRK